MICSFTNPVLPLMHCYLRTLLNRPTPTPHAHAHTHAHAYAPHIHTHARPRPTSCIVRVAHIRPHTAYSAAKFAVKGFTEALRTDFKLHAPHLTAHLVMPGFVSPKRAPVGSFCLLLVVSFFMSVFEPSLPHTHVHNLTRIPIYAKQRTTAGRDWHCCQFESGLGA